MKNKMIQIAIAIIPPGSPFLDKTATSYSLEILPKISIIKKKIPFFPFPFCPTSAPCSFCSALASQTGTDICCQPSRQARGLRTHTHTHVLVQLTLHTWAAVHADRLACTRTPSQTPPGTAPAGCAPMPGACTPSHIPLLAGPGPYFIPSPSLGVMQAQPVGSCQAHLLSPPTPNRADIVSENPHP